MKHMWQTFSLAIYHFSRKEMLGYYVPNSFLKVSKQQSYHLKRLNYLKRKC